MTKTFAATSDRYSADHQHKLLEDLKAQCIGADSDWLVSVISRGLDIETARAEWMRKRGPKACVPGDRASGKSLTPLRMTGEGTGGNQGAAADRKLAEFRADGLSKAQAVIKLKRELPHLFDAIS